MASITNPGQGINVETNMITKSSGDFRWEGVDVKPYKEDGTLFKGVSRQTLFAGGVGMGVEFRYFEIEPGGHSTLERHEHEHAVIISRGSGAVFVSDSVHPLELKDFIHVPPMTWHQFIAGPDEPLGFYCVVKIERDRPQRPSDEEFSSLVALSPEVANFLKR